MGQVPAGIDLQASVGYRLKATSAVLHTAMDEVLRPLGLTITQYSTLEQLAQRPGMSGSELARATFVTRQSMGQTLQSLLSERFISRAGAASHGRVLPVGLTDLGRRRLNAASTAVRQVEQRMLGGLTADEVAQLTRLLDGCITALRG